jgi:replicative DNA helicase
MSLAHSPPEPSESTIEAEQAVIGGALHDIAACAEALERLRPDHFADPVHGRVWDAILTRQRAELVADPVVISAALQSDPGFQQMGGITWLCDCIDNAAVWAVGAHVELILDAAARRWIVMLARDAADRAAKSHQETAEAILSDLERGCAEIAREGSTKPQAVPAGLSALDTIEAAWRGEFVGTSVGLECLDHVTGGIRQDDVWFLGGRTSMGKSAVALALARGIAEQGRGVMFFSLEMPLREVQARLISDIGYDAERRYDRGFENVRYGDLLKGRGSPEQKERVRYAARKLAALPLVVSDVGGLTIDDIRSQALRQMRAWEKAGVERGAILIDHIGLVKPAGRGRDGNKAAETADIVNELKAIAKQLRAPIIALCQVNRNTESRNDKHPTLADLNWSGAIEQIADMICLLYREAYYLERSPEHDDQDRAASVEHDIELMIHKNRSGPICTLKAFVDIASNVIRDYPEARR